MKSDVKAQWVAALRSGEYAQTKHTLKDDIGYCCLGVLCDLAVKEGVIPEAKKPKSEDRLLMQPDLEYGIKEPNSSTLPGEVMAWAGLEARNPMVRLDSALDFINTDRLDSHETPSLASLNDAGAEFLDIARLIEEQL